MLGKANFFHNCFRMSTNYIDHGAFLQVSRFQSFFGLWTEFVFIFKLIIFIFLCYFFNHNSPFCWLFLYSFHFPLTDGTWQGALRTQSLAVETSCGMAGKIKQMYKMINIILVKFWLENFYLLVITWDNLNIFQWLFISQYYIMLS